MVIGPVESEHQSKYHTTQVAACTRETGHDTITGRVDMWDNCEIGSVAGIYL